MIKYISQTVKVGEIYILFIHEFAFLSLASCN